MKYLEEFSDPELARRLLDDIHATATQPWAMMEVCGGQTHSIIRHGLDQLLPDGIELIHGPGCPVCVTPLEMIDKALEIASRPDVIFCSFGDMLRVPGSDKDLFRVKSAGGDVRVVYSPDGRARPSPARTPTKQVVFFGIGFETTAPPNAMTVYQAKRLGIENFSLLVSHVRVPPAIEAIMTVPGVPGAGVPRGRPRVHGDGHRGVPGARRAVPGADRGHRLRAARHPRGHPAHRAPARGGPARGRERLRPGGLRRRQPDRDRGCSRTCSRSSTAAWRGIGMIPQSGWRLSEKYREYDAEHRFAVTGIDTQESTVCRSGEVLQGLIKPHECEAFGTACTPRNPLGATMVSSEGACAAYYLYRRLARRRNSGRPQGGELRWLSSTGDLAAELDHRSSATAMLRRRADFEGWTCPVPLRDSPTIVMGHGGGGAMSAELVEHLFLPALRQRAARPARRLRGARRSAVPGSRSPPTRSWCARCSSPAAASATSRSTAPSTTSR